MTDEEIAFYLRDWFSGTSTDVEILDDDGNGTGEGKYQKQLYELINQARPVFEGFVKQYRLGQLVETKAAIAEQSKAIDVAIAEIEALEVAPVEEAAEVAE